MLLLHQEMEGDRRLDLIDDLQRLAISHHFEQEINKILNSIYHENCYDAKDRDLYTTSLEFRLLREHGFLVSQDVFDCFKNEKGDFKASLCDDRRGVLELYEASFLLTHGEETLELANEFATKHLQRIVEEGGDDHNLLERVRYALDLPIHWRIQRPNARWFIEAYGRRSEMNPTILELAKLEFNITQSMHQQELKLISSSVPVILSHTFFLITNPIQKTAVESLYQYQDLVRCPAVILRLANDLATSPNEMERGDVAESIQCYMKESGASVEEAREHARFLIWKSWKRMNEERVGNFQFPKEFIKKAVDLGRMAQYMYQLGDGHGIQNPHIKDRISRYTKERSSIVVIGLSIHTAPVEMREKLAIPEAEWPRAISELCDLNHIEEAAVLSTCNRMEIYVVALCRHRGVKEVTEWMSKTSGIPSSEICEHRFLLYDQDATQHIFEVSAGLVNVKSWLKTETNIAAGAVSVSSAAVELALMKLPEASHSTATMLVVGAGKGGDQTLGCQRVHKDGGSESKRRQTQADVVFTSTASETPLFLKEHVVDLPPVAPKSWKNACRKWDLSRGIVNKLLHGPMQHLRCDGSDSHTLTETLENMHALNRMFSLETEISVLEQKIRAKVEQAPK
ncbi:hypothetical protein SASPL_118599 [Salvia splendens]|uniref:Glutamyl-tRNA reductase n=1 Tax=Salvia splendens TaxID=180675 RepID=A0A8X8ZYV4_SALSN|nr:hypothetical protein SASPL_118599 [Salvia splendens]